jgi:hypothetical protein
LTREFAGRALDDLSRNDCRLKIWIDHGVAPTNFGCDIMRGSGDVPGSKAFHADLTCGFGVRYVWRGRVTSQPGQNADPSWFGNWNARYPFASGRTSLKELSKRYLGRLGYKKYSLHRNNKLAEKINLRSGQAAIEFIRSNPHWGGVSSGDTAEGLGELLSPSFLDRLVKRKGLCILYTHLGKKVSIARPYNSRVREGLKVLARYARIKEILVTTTRRLLDFSEMVKKVAIQEVIVNGFTRLDIKGEEEREALEGLTIYMDNPLSARLFVNDREIHDLILNPPDDTGHRSISLPWKRLEFPEI